MDSFFYSFLLYYLLLSTFDCRYSFKLAPISFWLDPHCLKPFLLSSRVNGCFISHFFCPSPVFTSSYFYQRALLTFSWECYIEISLWTLGPPVAVEVKLIPGLPQRIISTHIFILIFLNVYILKNISSCWCLQSQPITVLCPSFLSFHIWSSFLYQQETWCLLPCTWLPRHACAPVPHSKHGQLAFSTYLLCDWIVHEGKATKGKCKEIIRAIFFCLNTFIITAFKK